MLTFFLQLFLAHLIGDFLLQPSHWVVERNANKIKSKYLYFHILVHAALLAVLLQLDVQYWLGFIIIVFSHWLIDLIKVFLDKKCNKVFLFLGDQAAHILIILGITHFYYPLFSISWEAIFSIKVTLTLITLILLTSFTSYFINSLLESTLLKKSSKGSLFIGILERLLIFICIISNQVNLIGFLLASKFVGIGIISKQKNKKMREFIIVGTLLSFGLAIVVSLAYKYLIQLL